ncbi:MAG: hypothetical protein HRU35_02630 [Rickettsiaceae bacterium]|nr:hypothetical protein [Rickettsiaceae bacterium]
MGALNICDTELQAKQAMVHEYVSEIIKNIRESNGKVGNLIDHIAAFKSVAIGCYTNADVRYFNEKIRNHLKRSGILKGKDYAFISGSEQEQRIVNISLGEQIIFESGKKKFKSFGGVNNREIAIVTKIHNCDDKGIGSFEARIIRKNSHNQDYLETVTIRTGEKIFPIKFNHAYALTSHIFQGAKVQKMLMYFEKYYESLMVLATRHVNELKIYIAKEIMENFVYAKKDLDITKAREDYQIQAYTTGNKPDENGNQEPHTKEPYPVYKIGKYLSSSKRADLNSSLSNDYGYNLPKKEQQYLQDLKDKVRYTEDKILELRFELKKWLGSNSKKIRKNISRKFKLKSKEIIIIDPLKVAKSNRSFKDKLILAGDNPVDEKTLNLKVIEHLGKITCKKKSRIGIISKKPEWGKLALDDGGADDQNLIIYNSLNKKSKDMLGDLVKEHSLCEKQIKARTKAVEKYQLQLQQLAKENKQITGNHLIVSKYSKALKELAEVLKKLELWQEKYLSPARQNVMQEKIAKNLHINMAGVKNLKVNPYMLLSASKQFKRDYVNRHENEITHLQKLKKELSENPDKNNLDEYQKINQSLDKLSLENHEDLAVAIKDYLKDMSLKILDNNDKPLEKKTIWNNLKPLDKHLIVRSILTNSAMQKLKLLFEEKLKIKQELTKNAKIICKNYDGFVRPDLTKELEEKKQQLEQEHTSGNSNNNKLETNKLVREISRLTKQITDASKGISNDPLQMKMKDVLNSENLNFETVRGHANETDYKFYFENVSVKPSLLEHKNFNKEFVSLLQTMLDHRNMSHDKVTLEELNNTSIKVNLLKEFINSQENS